MKARKWCWIPWNWDYEWSYKYHDSAENLTQGLMYAEHNSATGLPLSQGVNRYGSPFPIRPCSVHIALPTPVTKGFSCSVLTPLLHPGQAHSCSPEHTLLAIHS